MRPDGEGSVLPPVLLQYWQVVLRWKWVMIAIIAIALVAGLLATLLATPQYTATVRLEISREFKNVTKVEGLESERSGQNIEFFQTQYSLLEARSLAERVARRLRLAADERLFNAHGAVPAPEDAMFENRTSARALSSARLKQVVDLLLAHVQVTPVRGSSLVDVNYTPRHGILAVAGQ